MKTEWKDVTIFDCPNCGGGLSVLSPCLEKDDIDGFQYFQDGDKVKCNECKFESYMTADEDSCYVNDCSHDCQTCEDGCLNFGVKREIESL